MQLNHSIGAHWSRYSVRHWITLLVLLCLNLLLAPTLQAQNRADPAATGREASELRQWIQARSAQMALHVGQPQQSPDGRFVAVTVVPLGTETAALARTQIYATASRNIRHTLAGHTPRWHANANNGDALLQLESSSHGTAVYQIGLTARAVSLPRQQLHATRVDSPAPTAIASAATDLSYPSTIRVLHHPSNGCRDVPDWQIDQIPFEEYVARVVPAETPASWPTAALAAQAVAARTYAWRQILAQRADYDVTDWANFQMMCDERTPKSDAAVAMTAGQYLAEVGHAVPLPISAMYSAENGHPTLTNTNVTYLQSVPDRFALGRTRWGHGFGLSQWGAYRRARAGHDYRQILGHYYSNVYLTNGLNQSTPIGTLLHNDRASTVTAGPIPLAAMVQPELTPRFVITASHGLTTSITITGNNLLWHPTSPLPQGALITATLWISDEWQAEEQWQVDYSTPPAPTTMGRLELPTAITQPTFGVTLPLVDAIPLLMHSNWSWQGTDLHHTPNSGSTVADPATASGQSWAADPTVDVAGVWYGPYTSDLAAGHSYRALFWLRTTRANHPASVAPAAADPIIAKLDVTDNGGAVGLGLHQLRQSDFATFDGYTPIAVDFYLAEAPTGLEFRVAWAGERPLALDRVELWQLADHYSTTAEPNAAHFQATVRSTTLTETLYIRYANPVGKVSEPHVHQAPIVDREPPIFHAATTPLIVSDEAVANGITLTATVTDELSGLEPSSGFVTVAADDFAASQAVRTAEHHPRQAAQMYATLSNNLDLPTDRELFTLTFTAQDRAGNLAQVDRALVIDRYAPQVVLTTAASPAGGWHTEPLSVTLTATDSASGLQTLMYTVTQQSAGVTTNTVITHSNLHRGFDIAPRARLETIHLDAGGLYTLTAQAVDQVGRVAESYAAVVSVDLAAPMVQLTQQTVDANTVRLSWQSSDDGSGVNQIELQIRRDTETWQVAPWQQQSSAGEADVTLIPEQPTFVRMRAQDQLGHWSEWQEIRLWAATDQIYLPLIVR